MISKPDKLDCGRAQTGLEIRKTARNIAYKIVIEMDYSVKVSLSRLR
jgi:hypothetical protein